MKPHSLSRLYRGSLALLLASAGVLAQDTTSGLVAHYKFDNDLLDSSGSMLHLGPGGTFQYVADRDGTGNGAVQLITPAGNGTFFLGTGPTLANRSSSVALWVRKDYAPNGVSGGSWIFGLGHAPGVGGQRGEDMAVCLDYGSSIRYSFFYDDLDINVSMPRAEWHHIACTFDYSSRRREIFLDGVLIATDFAPVPFSGANHLSVGFPGITLDDLRFYDRLLSAADVEALAEREPDPDELAECRAEQEELRDQIAQLEAEKEMLSQELSSVRAQLDVCQQEQAQALLGLDGIWRLIQLPVGKRGSSMVFTGEAGEKINQIISALISAPGQSVSSNK